MAEPNEIIAIHPDDFADLQAMRREWATTQRPQAGVTAKRRGTAYDCIRVMIISDDYPVYSPRSERAVAFFVRDTSSETITLEMFGDNLSGDINVTIDGVLYRANCQLGTEALRDLFGFPLRTCRVTAFPGLWEFAFSGVAPTITVEPAVGTVDVLTFTGGVVVTSEAWVSVADPYGNLMTVRVIESIPYSEGEVKPGSVSVAQWSADVGWMVTKWYCREFRFRLLDAEYSVAGGVGGVVDEDGNSIDPNTGLLLVPGGTA